MSTDADDVFVEVKMLNEHRIVKGDAKHVVKGKGWIRMFLLHLRTGSQGHVLLQSSEYVTIALENWLPFELFSKLSSSLREWTATGENSFMVSAKRTRLEGGNREPGVVSGTRMVSDGTAAPASSAVALVPAAPASSENLTLTALAMMGSLTGTPVDDRAEFLDIPNVQDTLHSLV